MTVEQAFGNVIKRQRQKLSISQEKLAELAELHRTYISQLERGLKSPSLGALFSIASALQTQPHLLILEVEQELSNAN